MPDEIFGPLVSFYDVESGLLDHIELWLPPYLRARERLWGLTVSEIPLPRSWIIRQTFDLLPGEEQTPAVVVVSGGSSDMTSHGDQHVSARLAMAVVVLCHGSEANFARELSGHYQAAVGTMLMHKPKFDIGAGYGRIIEWSGFGIEDMVDQERTLCPVRLDITVEVPSFATSMGGPKTLPPDPDPVQPDLPVVQIPVDVSTVSTEVMP